MPRTCAFCPATAKLSGEHIWSDWMRELFKSKRIRFFQRDAAGEITNTWTSKNIDLTAKVVCKSCNEGWMSALESKHAKPAMAELIVGNKDVVISQKQARSIAVFAFKTAVIIDHIRDAVPFFPTPVRLEFAKSLAIPRNVNMWLTAFAPQIGGRVHSVYHEARLVAPYSLHIYACTFSAGHLVFQVVGAKYVGVPFFQPKESFEHLSVPFFPILDGDLSWPLGNALRSSREFDRFAERWRIVEVVV